MFETILANRSGQQCVQVTVREKHAKVLLRGQREESFAALTSPSSVTMQMR